MTNNKTIATYSYENVKVSKGMRFRLE